MIDILIDYGVQLQGRQPLQEAAMIGRVNITERLLDRGVDVNGIPDSDDIDFLGICRLGTALPNAARYDKKDSATTLL